MCYSNFGVYEVLREQMYVPKILVHFKTFLLVFFVLYEYTTFWLCYNENGNIVFKENDKEF